MYAEARIVIRTCTRMRRRGVTSWHISMVYATAPRPPTRLPPQEAWRSACAPRRSSVRVPQQEMAQPWRAPSRGRTPAPRRSRARRRAGQPECAARRQAAACRLGRLASAGWACAAPARPRRAPGAPTRAAGGRLKLRRSHQAAERRCIAPPAPAPPARAGVCGIRAVP